MTEAGIEITKDLTIPKLFVKQCRKYGKSKVAMRGKGVRYLDPLYLAGLL